MDYRRDYLPGATYFFTVTTNHRRPILIDEIDRLRQAFRHTMKARPFKIVAIVVLPDHLHSIWTLPQDDTDFSFRWQQIKRNFSAGLASQPVSRSKVSKHEKGIWQRRFWAHRIRDEDDWRRHVDYIHFNPVKHGYVSRPDMWPYSSFSRYVARGIYAPDWGVSQVGEVDIPVGE